MAFKTSVVCIICGGHLFSFWNGFFCEGCGIHYHKLPSKRVVERLRKKDESILRMSPHAKKKFAKKMDEIQANLNHNVRMK
jgi:hypothetical protein